MQSRQLERYMSADYRFNLRYKTFTLRRQYVFCLDNIVIFFSISLLYYYIFIFIIIYRHHFNVLYTYILVRILLQHILSMFMRACVVKLICSHMYLLLNRTITSSNTPLVLRIIKFKIYWINSVLITLYDHTFLFFQI